MTHVSMIDRLMDLPVVFNLSHVARILKLNIEHSRDVNKIHVYLDRWKKKGLIQSAGPRSGIYYNLLMQRDAADECRGEALLMLYPSAVMCGNSVLHADGWTTQIPDKLEVAVLKRPSYASLYHFDIQSRSRDWYVQFNDHIVKQARWSLGGIPSMTPVAAFVDMIERSVTLADDDLDIPEEALPVIAGICHKNGIALPNWLSEKISVGKNEFSI
jgi:hypothetical protein